MTYQNSKYHCEDVSYYLQLIQLLQQGEYHLDRSIDPDDELGQALQHLAHILETHDREQRWLDQITTQINAGLKLDEILENIYRDFHGLIPYNRIGLSLIEKDGQTVRSEWAKSDQPRIRLAAGYAAPLAGSSLETILQTEQPRIINDLEEYLRQKPRSKSTKLIVQEGMRSSLTCPLIANGVPVGFIFFSSTQPYAYAEAHVGTFQRIAGRLSVIVEKGRLVSELAAQKEAIEQQNQELLRLSEMKNNFLGIATHDLRSPIGTIHMAVTFLRDSYSLLSDQERQTILEDMMKQSSYMLDLLDDLLDVTRIESGKLDLHLELIDLPDFLAESVQRHDRMATPKGTQVLLDSAPPGTISADRLRLRQVMDNLISNAVKFSPAGSTVRVYAEQLDSEWRISVQDEGPGIPPEERELLFQDFSRLSARPTGGERSTGLGLAITRRVIEAHGGQIDVDSIPGQSATFWFTLPAS